eukprot:g9807.t1
MTDNSEWKKLATTLLHEEPELTHRERAERCGVSVEAMKRFCKGQPKVATSKNARPAASQMPEQEKGEDGESADTNPLGKFVSMLQQKQLEGFSNELGSETRSDPLGSTSLVRNHIDILQSLGNLSLDISDRHSPSSKPNDALVNFLMQQKNLMASADPNDQLYSAAELGDLKRVELLIPQASDLNWRYKDGSSALWIASRRGHRAIAKRLLIEPAVRVDNTSLHGSGNVLHLWSEKEMEEVELMQLALKKGADVNEVDEQNQTPLFFAARRGHAGTVRLLMEWGADPTVRQGGSNCLPFTTAAERGHLGVLQVLYEFSSCANPIPYADGLFFAAQENQTATVRALVETWGANPNVMSTLKMTPVFIAASEGNEETASVLMKAGAIDSVFAPGEVDQGLILGSALEIALAHKETSLDALVAILGPMIASLTKAGSKNASEKKMVMRAGMEEISNALDEAYNYNGKLKHTPARSKKKTTAELYPTLYHAPKLVSDPVIFRTRPRKASKPQGAAALQNGSGNDEKAATTSTNTSGAGRAGGGSSTVGTGRSVSFLSESESAGLTSESARSSGNEALKTGEKEKALAYYERAFQLSEEKCVLAASNAAECCLRLDNPAAAIEWTLRSMRIDPDHEKTLFRHVKALAKARRTTEGCVFLADYFAKALQNVSDNMKQGEIKDSESERSEELRLEELRLELFHACMTSARNTKAFTRGLYVERVEAAGADRFPSYRICTGIAIPALKNITKETAFLPWDHKILSELSRFLSTATEDKLAQCNGIFPRHFEEFQPALDCCGSLAGFEPRVSQAVDQHSKQLAKELGRVPREMLNSAERRRNVMRVLGCAKISSHDGGLYHFGALYNHSCAANCEVHGMHDLDVITTRDIRPGEELCISYHGGGIVSPGRVPDHTYMQMDWGVGLRRCSLRKCYGFWCSCERCEAEEKSGEERHNISKVTSVAHASVKRECEAAEKSWVDFQEKVLPIMNRFPKNFFLDAKALRDAAPDWKKVSWQKCYLIANLLGAFQHDINRGKAPSVLELDRHEVLKHALELFDARKTYVFPHSRFNGQLYVLLSKFLDVYMGAKRVPRDASLNLTTQMDLAQERLGYVEFIRHPADLTPAEIEAANKRENRDANAAAVAPECPAKESEHQSESEKLLGLLSKTAEICAPENGPDDLSTAEKYQDHLRSNAIDDTVLDVDKDMEETKKMVEMFRKLPRQATAKIGQLMTRRPPSLHDEYLGLQKISGADFPTSAMSASIRAWCAKSFERGYWNSCLQPWLLSKGLKEGVPDSINEQERARRFGGVVKKRWATTWLESLNPPLKYGQIIRYNHDGQFWARYTNTQRSSYSNHPNKPVLLEFGDTHVAVGFNDLRILANGIYSNSEGAEFQASRTSGSATSGTAPDYDSSTCSGRVPVQLRFVGLDCSTYAVAVAKCLAIAEMLEIAGRTVPEHVLQVWYSAAWSKGATKTFKAAVRAALAKHKERMQQTSTGHLSGFETASDREGVRNYLEFWAHADAPSLQQAREEWVKTYHPNNTSRTRTMGFICSMSRKKDRQAVSRYMVSGDVFWTEKPAEQDLVGSMTNYAVPARSPYLDEDLIFNAVGWDELIARFESGSNETTDSTDPDSVAAGSPGNSKKSFKLKVTKTALQNKGSKPPTSATPHTDTDPDDIVQQTTQLLYEQIQNLHRLVQAKKIAIELNCVTVSADNVALQQAIRAIRPHTITWSNVLDYFAVPSQFHKTARACSTDEKTEGAVTTETRTSTRHYGYSMNWPEVTFGTHLMDYPLRDRKKILDLSEETDSGKWNNLGMCSKVDEGEAHAAADAGSAQVAAKVQSVIRGRMIYPPFDSPFNTTGWFLMNRYAKNWVDYFFEGEEVQLHQTGGIPYQPLMKSANTSVNFSWTYNCTQRADEV